MAIRCRLTSGHPAFARTLTVFGIRIVPPVCGGRPKALGITKLPIRSDFSVNAPKDLINALVCWHAWDCHNWINDVASHTEEGMPAARAATATKGMAWACEGKQVYRNGAN